MLRAVVEQHAEEAAFLWLLRDASATAPDVDADDLARIDERLEAHVDGLRIAGASGWGLARRALEEEREEGEAFVAAVLAFESGGPARVEALCDVVSGEPSLARPVASALAWTGERAAAHLPALFAADSPVVRRAGLAASALLRRRPGVALDAALLDDDELLRARALDAIGEVGLVERHAELEAELHATAAGCRFSAAWSLTRLGRRSALHTLVAAADAGGARAERAAATAARAMTAAYALRWIEALAGRAPRAAIAAAGAFGDASSLPRLVAWLSDRALARVAAEAITSITGLAIAGALRGERPEEDDQEEEDEDAPPDRDARLPWPAPRAVARAVEARRDDLPTGRLLLGRPIEAMWLREVITRGTQRQRAAAAFELGRLAPAEPLVEVRARRP